MNAENNNIVDRFNFPRITKISKQTIIVLIGITLMAFASVCNALVVDVTAYGADGTDTTDDYSAIQNAINDAYRISLALGERGSVYIPAGIYYIGTTLTVSNCHGITIYGDGARGGLHNDGWDYNTSSVLKWTGSTDGTLLEMDGVLDSTIRDMAFDGDDKAGILVHYKYQAGYGTSDNGCMNVSFCDAGVGIQQGTLPTDFNCDTYSMRRVYFRGLDSGFKVKNVQAVGHEALHISAAYCGKIFDFEKGGNLSVMNLNCTSCDWVLYSVGGGCNASTFLLQGIRTEGDTGPTENRARFIYANGPMTITVIAYNSVLGTYDDTVALCEFNTGVTATFLGCTLSGKVADLRHSTPSYRTTLRVERSKMSNPSTAINRIDSETAYKVIDCTNMTGELKEDVSSGWTPTAW